jgi:hypothetical protein
MSSWHRNICMCATGAHQGASSDAERIVMFMLLTTSLMIRDSCNLVVAEVQWLPKWTWFSNFWYKPQCAGRIFARVTFAWKVMWSSSPSFLPFSYKTRVLYLKVRVLKKGILQVTEDLNLWSFSLSSPTWCWCSCRYPKLKTYFGYELVSLGENKNIATFRVSANSNIQGTKTCTLVVEHPLPFLCQ